MIEADHLQMVRLFFVKLPVVQLFPLFLQPFRTVSLTDELQLSNEKKVAIDPCLKKVS